MLPLLVDLSSHHEQRIANHFSQNQVIYILVLVLFEQSRHIDMHFVHFSIFTPFVIIFINAIIIMAYAISFSIFYHHILKIDLNISFLLFFCLLKTTHEQRD